MQRLVMERSICETNGEEYGKEEQREEAEERRSRHGRVSVSETGQRTEMRS